MVITTNYQMTASPSSGVESAASRLLISQSARSREQASPSTPQLAALSRPLSPQPRARPGPPECFPCVLCPPGQSVPHLGASSPAFPHRTSLTTSWGGGCLMTSEMDRLTQSGPGSPDPRSPEDPSSEAAT